jgi:transcriptional regulator of heat shock response
MKDRKEQILKTIIEHFITTANPVGSKVLTEVYKFPCSPATIRNEMHSLEQEGFLESPHTSAGRVPTTFGFRFFVSELLQKGGIDEFRPQIKQDFNKAKETYFESKKADEKIFDTVSILTQLTENVAFATIPSNKRTFFLGASKILAEPEFSHQPDLASSIFRVLEEDFVKILSSLDLKEEVQVFIGKENIIPEIQSCTLIASSFDVYGHKGALGILGPIRMNFARNILALEESIRFLNEKT